LDERGETAPVGRIFPPLKKNQKKIPETRKERFPSGRRRDEIGGAGVFQSCSMKRQQLEPCQLARGEDRQSGAAWGSLRLKKPFLGEKKLCWGGCAEEKNGVWMGHGRKTLIFPPGLGGGKSGSTRPPLSGESCRQENRVRGSDACARKNDRKRGGWGKIGVG